MQEVPLIRSLWLAATMSAGLAAVPAGFADVVDPGPRGEPVASDAGVFDGDGETRSRTDAGPAYGPTQLALFEVDDLIEDERGYYDDDFDWHPANSTWDYDWFDPDASPEERRPAGAGSDR